jgi:UDP-N-acetylglucosamine 2-epimerase
MRIVSVVGTRPQLIKAAALLPVLEADGHDVVLVDTGQHWDAELAANIMAELGLGSPDHSLGVAAPTRATQTAAMLERLEPVLRDTRPDAVLVFGDTNSTLAGALAAAQLDLPVAHVEAGLRSFDRAMPEEVNRVVADHLSRWLFAPTETAVINLRNEGIDVGVHLVGDLMQDLAARVLDGIRDLVVLGTAAERLGFAITDGGYVLATIHRAENRGPAQMRRWSAILEGAASERPVVLALHPGTRDALESAGITLAPGVVVVPPQGYRTTLALQLHAAAVITDSGGVQREAAWLGVPCLVLRDRTEWVEAVAGSGGRMVTVGLDRDLASRELERLAPAASAPAWAAARAASVVLEASGAAQAISRILASVRRDGLAPRDASR